MVERAVHENPHLGWSPEVLSSLFPSSAPPGVQSFFSSRIEPPRILGAESPVPDGNVVYSSAVGFPGGSVGKESSCNAGDTGDMSSVPRSERSSGEGHGNPLQHSCLENPMGSGAWRATVYRVTKRHNWSNWAKTICLILIVYTLILLCFGIIFLEVYSKIIPKT